MPMRTDPFRELDRLSKQLVGATGTWSRPAVMQMDAYRHGEEFVVHFDLPGVHSPQAGALGCMRRGGRGYLTGHRRAGSRNSEED